MKQRSGLGAQWCDITNIAIILEDIGYCERQELPLIRSALAVLGGLWGFSN